MAVVKGVSSATPTPTIAKGDAGLSQPALIVITFIVTFSICYLLVESILRLERRYDPNASLRSSYDYVPRSSIDVVLRSSVDVLPSSATVYSGRTLIGTSSSQDVTKVTTADWILGLIKRSLLQNWTAPEGEL